MDEFEAYIQRLKSAVRIEDVIGEDEPLTTRSGHFVRGAQHDSLVIDTEKGTYHWNSTGEFGDVIEWMKLHRGMDFKTAVEELAARAGMDAPSWGRGSSQQRLAAQAKYDAFTVAARWYVRTLRRTPAAMAYCEARGWSADTIRDAGLGVWDGDKEGLRGEFRMHGVDVTDKVARALMQMPSGMLVYPHVLYGHVRYVSCRSIERKRHWNPPRDLVGEREPYWNYEAVPGRDEIVVCEGQADAVTLAQWGFPAVAMAGVKVGGTEPGTYLLKQLGEHSPVFVALDRDDAGAVGAKALAQSLSPLVHVVRWPDHDANDWLRNDPDGATTARAGEILEASPTYIEVFAEQVGGLTNSKRIAGMRELMGMVSRLGTFERAEMRSKLAKAAGLGLREYDKLLKVAEEQREEGGAGGEDDDGPLLSVMTVGGLIGENLVELVYEPPEGAAGLTNRAAGETKLAIRDGEGAIAVRKFLEVDDIRYVPVEATSPVLIEEVVRFAPEVGELMSTRDLVRLIQATINKYVDVDVFYETLSAYYVIFTWLYDAFNTLPYLRLLGDAGTGKSRFLQVVGSLCYRPTIVSGAATTSPIFRLIDRYRGTLVMDESDFGQSDETSDLIKIFNTGYQRAQGIVLRAGAKENNFDPDVFVVYGPKILAGRKRFADWAVESRCLTKEMGGPTVRTDIPIELPRTFWNEEVPRIQGLLLRYRLEHWQPERELDYSQLDSTVEPRLNQVMLSLVSVIDDPDLKEDLRRFMQAYNQQLIAERGMTLTAKCLEALVAQHEMEPEDLTLKTVARRMNQIMDWENLDEGELRERGRDITPKRAGSITRTDLQLQTDRDSRHNGRYAVVYNEARVDALRGRYGIDDDRLRDILAAIYDMEQREQDEQMAQAQAAMNAFGGA